MNSAQKLDYVAGKLGLIPAFGNSIGKDVNKAELSLCQKMAKDAEASHAELLAAAKLFDYAVKCNRVNLSKEMLAAIEATRAAITNAEASA